MLATISSVHWRTSSLAHQLWAYDASTTDQQHPNSSWAGNHVSSPKSPSGKTKTWKRQNLVAIVTVECVYVFNSHIMASYKWQQRKTASKYRAKITISTETLHLFNNADPHPLHQLAIPPASFPHLSWSFPTCVFPPGIGTLGSSLLASPDAANPTYVSTVSACMRGILSAVIPAQVHWVYRFLCVFFYHSHKNLCQWDWHTSTQFHKWHISSVTFMSGATLR